MTNDIQESFEKSRIAGSIAAGALDEVEKIAKERNCCKITLEVLEGNTVAKGSYIKFGFGNYELDPAFGKAMFWEKEL